MSLSGHRKRIPNYETRESRMKIYQLGSARASAGTIMTTLGYHIHATGIWRVDLLFWRHNGRDGVSNHQPHDCLLNRLFRRRSKKTSKLRVTGLCAGNSPETAHFPWSAPSLYLNQWKLFVNSLRPSLDRRPFADDIFKCVFLNENEWVLPRISLKFVPKVRINNIPALVQIMAWRRPGDKPLSEPMMVSLLTHICVTRPQWVNWTIGKTHFMDILIKIQK